MTNSSEFVYGLPPIADNVREFLNGFPVKQTNTRLRLPVHKTLGFIAAEAGQSLPAWAEDYLTRVALDAIGDVQGLAALAVEQAEQDADMLGDLANIVAKQPTG